MLIHFYGDPINVSEVCEDLHNGVVVMIVTISTNFSRIEDKLMEFEDLEVVPFGMSEPNFYCGFVNTKLLKGDLNLKKLKQAVGVAARRFDDLETLQRPYFSTSVVFNPKTESWS